MHDGWSALDLAGWIDRASDALPTTVSADDRGRVLDDTRPIVLLDMDGVLCDFVRQAYRACGVPEVAISALESTIEDWGDVHRPLGMTPTQMWAHIDDWGEHFWSHMPLRQGAIAALRTAEQMGDVLLCSSPSSLAESRSGKHKWVQRHMPDYAGRLILIREKWMLAAPGRTLIDDRPHNCEAFIAHGGEAFLYPHRYNANSSLPRFRSRDLRDTI